MTDVRTRQLAAIMFADMVGYTALMQDDEDGARAQRDLHRAIFTAAVERHHGTVVQYYGDGTLSLFNSAVEAVECAVEVQNEVRDLPIIPLRIGVHTGDVVRDGDGIYGDSVNIASRIENLSAPGGVLVSGKVFDEIKNHGSITAVPIGAVRLKNVGYRLALFAIANDELAIPDPAEIRSRTRKEGAAAFTEATDTTGEDGSPVPPMRLGVGEVFLQQVQERAIAQWLLLYVAVALVMVQSLRFAGDLLQWSPLIARGASLIAFVGFFGALTVAWFHGEKGRQRVQRTEIVLLAGLLIVAAAGLRLLPSSAGLPETGQLAVAGFPGTADTRPSIAVLPWDNRSGAEEDAYFADGIHDEILTRLSKIGGLRVIARQSVMQFRDSPLTVGQIADELGVHYILHAGLLRVRDTVRVNVQLIDGHTESVAWAATEDRYLTMENLLAIQAEIAQTIADTLKATVTPAERAEMERFETDNLEAYDYYLQGRGYYLRPGYVKADFEAAQELFEEAITLDSAFALAHAALSRVHGIMYWERFDPTPDRLAAQHHHAEESLRLQPDLPQAHLAIGWWHYVNGDFRQALDEYTAARRGLPNDGEIVAMIGYTHRRLGNWPEAFTAFQEAIRLNPRDATLFYDLGGHSYAARRRFAEAIRSYDRALSLAPDFHDAALRKGETWANWTGQLDTLRAIVDRLPADLHAPDIDVARADLALRERDGDALLRLVAAQPRHVYETQLVFLPGSLYAAWAYRLLGNEPAAIAAFDSAAVFLEPLARERPDDERIVAALGFARAGAGRVREAAQIAQRVIRASPDNVFSRLQATELAARICAQASLATRAVSLLEGLLADTSRVTIHTLRLDPLYDPIRESPEFQELLMRHANDLPQRDTSRL